MRKLVIVLITAALGVGLFPGAGMAQTAGNQQFTIMRAGAGPAVVVAHGLINGVGTETDNARQVPPGHPFHSRSTFSQGELFATVTYSGPPKVSFDPTMCQTRVVLTDRFVVTGGTGHFTAATGSGTDAVRVSEFRGRDGTGSCEGRDTPAVFELTIIRSTGTITLAGAVAHE